MFPDHRARRRHTPLPIPRMTLVGSAPGAVADHIAGLPETVAAFVIGLPPAENTVAQALAATVGDRLVVTDTRLLAASVGAGRPRRSPRARHHPRAETISDSRQRSRPAASRGIARSGRRRRPRDPFREDFHAGSARDHRQPRGGGRFTGRIAAWTPTAGILTPHCVLYRLCAALPGVVRALCGHPTAIPTPAVLAAAARAIATFTAPGRTLPDPDTPGRPLAVARAVTAALDGETRPAPAAILGRLTRRRHAPPAAGAALPRSTRRTAPSGRRTPPGRR